MIEQEIDECLDPVAERDLVVGEPVHGTPPLRARSRGNYAGTAA
jgi:hypothetical protein